MIPQKYKESTKLISQKIGKPNLVQQEIIISDIEIDNAKKCILLLKQKINELKLKNNNGKISVWIPYAELLEKELPSNKGTDVRLQKRVFSLLRIVPIIKSNHRKLLLLGKETSVIADLADLREVLSITQNYEGIPKYKIEFFNEIFYPCYQSKDGPDLSSDGTKKEEIRAVTTKQLCEFFKEKKGKPISTDNLKKVYLNELINNALIDSVDSKIHGRQDIYYPLIEPFNDNSDSSNSNGESLSFSSNLEQFDNISQFHSKIYEKITKSITETWLFCEIMRLLSHRIDLSNIREPLADYLNNHEEFQLLDNNNQCSYSVGKKEEKQSIVSEDNVKEIIGNSQKEKVEECCCNNINNNTNGSSRLTIRQFTKKYTDISSFQFDNKQSSNIASFDKISLIKSNLPKFDKIDIITDKNIESEKDSHNVLQTPLSLSLPKEEQKQQQQNRLFNNPLISESDLATGNYDPKIINNIDRIKETDRWFCNNCTMKDDKWFMMKHPCKNNKNNTKNK